MSELMLVFCSLLGVIGLIFLTFYATKWLNKKFRAGGIYGSGNGIKIIECIGLAQDKQLVAVKAGKKAMLLGVTAESVTKLSDLDDEDIEMMTSNTDCGASSFADNLRKALEDKFRKNTDNKTSEDKSEND